nr:hypothetical protein [Eubacterium sp.]
MDGSMLSDFGQALSEDYYVIIPTLHGMEGAEDTVFDSFDGECESIEKYVDSELGGKLDYAYGISMGATTIYNLLQRDEIKIDKAILDGTYTANQGIFAAYMTSTNYYDFHVKALAGEDFDLGIMKIGCVLMGISEEEGKAFFTEDMTKNPMTFENMSRASYANYTYQVDENALVKNTEVVLWCGSEEPYAIKSHNIIKPHLENYTEKIFEGYGHGELISNHTEECLDLIKKECQ